MHAGSPAALLTVTTAARARPWAVAALRALTVLFLAGLAAQFYLAGAGAFGATTYDAHAGVGLLLGLGALLLFVVSLAGRLPGRLSGLAGAMVGLVVLQVVLAGLQEASPWLAALHPVNALAIAAVAVLLARRMRDRALLG